MASGIVPLNAGHVTHSGRLGPFGGAESNGAVPSSAVPFVIRGLALTGAVGTTDTIVPVGALNHDFVVIDAWAVVTTAAAANEDWDIRTAAGDAGGTLICSMQMNSLADGARASWATAGAAGNGGTALVDRLTIDADSATVGLFIDKVDGADGAGAVYLLCVRV